MTWYVFESGGQIRQVQSLDGEDVEGKDIIITDRRGDLTFETIDADGNWTDNMEAVRKAVIAKIDAARETRQSEILTPGTAKALMYAQKAREVAVYRSLGAAAVDIMSEADRDAQFPAAVAEAAVTGETLHDVLMRIRAASASSELYTIEAKATAAKAAVRSASSAADVWAVLASAWD